MRRTLLAVAAIATAIALIWLAFSSEAAPEETVEPPVPVAAPLGLGKGPAPKIPAALRGHVTSASGAPAAGAAVRLLSEVGAREVTADPTGAFAFIDLPPGEYLLVASLGSLASETLGPIPLGEGEALEGLALALAQGATVAGVVLDGGTGEGLPGASLELGGQRLATDHAGRFRFIGLSPGEARLIASAEGFETRIQPFLIQPGTSSGIEVRLDRGAEVLGVVLDGEGAPVAGATVSPIRYQLGAAPPPTGRTLTDGAGRFRLIAPVGQVEIRAVAPSGAVATSPPLDLAPGGRLRDLILRLEPLSQLFGEVVDGRGAAVPGAQVHLSDGAGRLLASTSSGAGGRFSFSGIPTGMVRLTAVSGASRGIAGPIGVSGGEAAPVIVTLGGGVVEGRVEDDRGQPAVGARVSIWPEGGPKEFASGRVTGPDGRFHIEGLPEGPLRVEADGGTGRAERRAVFAGDDVLLVLGGGRLVGRVLLDDRPATDFHVFVAPLDPGGVGARSERFLSPDGTFALELPPGRYELRATAQGAGLGRQVADVPSRGDSMEALLELSSGGTVEGVVLSEATGLPLEGVRVSIHRGGTWAVGQGTPTGRAFVSVTDGEGRFRLTGIPTGRMPIFARKPGWRAGRPPVVAVEAGATGTVEIRLAEGEEGGESAFGGIGMTLMSMGEGIGVAWVIDGGPAWEAGVRRGDRVVAIDGLAVADLREAVDKVRGPVGTPVTLSLLRGDTSFRAVALRTEVRF